MPAPATAVIWEWNQTIKDLVISVSPPFKIISWFSLLTNSWLSLTYVSTTKLVTALHRNNTFQQLKIKETREDNQHMFLKRHTHHFHVNYVAKPTVNSRSEDTQISESLSLLQVPAPNHCRSQDSAVILQVLRFPSIYGRLGLHSQLPAPTQSHPSILGHLHTEPMNESSYFQYSSLLPSISNKYIWF